MNNANTLRLKFIESYLRDGGDSATFNDLKGQLYQNGYSQMDVVSFVVEGKLYGNLDKFYRRNPNLR